MVPSTTSIGFLLTCLGTFYHRPDPALKNLRPSPPSMLSFPLTVVSLFKHNLPRTNSQKTIDLGNDHYLQKNNKLRLNRQTRFMQQKYNIDKCNI
jgi:hypothetical protein